MTAKNPIVLLVFSILLLSSAVFQTNYFQQIVSTKAQTSVSMIKVSLAGNFSDTNRASYKTKVTLYTKNGKAKELIDQPLVHDRQNVFTLALDLNSLDLGQFYAINIADLLGQSREKKFSFPRQIIMHLMRKELSMSYPAIGNELGGRDHTTAMHADNKITRESENDLKLKQEIELIKQKLYINMM